MKPRRPPILPLALSLLIAACVYAEVFAPSACARDKHFAKASADPARDKVEEGLVLIRKHDWDGAIDSFKQAIYFARNQYNPDAYKYLGLCYRATRNYQKAIDTFQKYFDQATTPSPDVHIDLAECYVETKDFDKARRELELGAAADAETQKFRYRQRFAYGELHEKLGDTNPNRRAAAGDYDQAAQFYKEAMEEKPLYTDAWMALGKIEMKIGNWNDALQVYRGILDKGPLLHPDLVELYYNMGTCLLKHGDHQGALDHYRMALEQNPDSFDAHLAIANILDSEKHLSTALEEYQAALRCADKDSPQRSPIMNKIDYIEQQLQPKDVPVPIRPSPAMRHMFDDSQSPAAVNNPNNNNNLAPVSKDAGF